MSMTMMHTEGMNDENHIPADRLGPPPSRSCLPRRKQARAPLTRGLKKVKPAVISGTSTEQGTDATGKHHN